MPRKQTLSPEPVTKASRSLPGWSAMLAYAW